MKTICVLDGKIIMSQGGDAAEVMALNAEQHPGATVEVIEDSEFDLRMAAQEDARKSYRERRASAYPSIGDQLDALWKGGIAAEEMLARINNVKSTYPKEV